MSSVGSSPAMHDNDSLASGAPSTGADERRAYAGASMGSTAGPSRSHAAFRSPPYEHRDHYRSQPEVESAEHEPVGASQRRYPASGRGQGSRPWTDGDRRDEDAWYGEAREERRWNARDDRGYDDGQGQRFGGGEYGYGRSDDYHRQHHSYTDEAPRERYESDRWNVGPDRHSYQPLHQQASAYSQHQPHAGYSNAPRQDDPAVQPYRYAREEGSSSRLADAPTAFGKTVDRSTPSGRGATGVGSSGAQASVASKGFSKVSDGKRYSLVVVQHPERARMCGFGDKDRRPLSPTLIVKLIITDEATGKEISPIDVNSSLFLLATDLCHPDDLMQSPRNILVHPNAPALSASGMGFGSIGGGRTEPAGMPSSHPLHMHPDGSGKLEQEPMQARGRSAGTTHAGDPGSGGQLPSIASLDLPGRARSTSDAVQEPLSAGGPRGYGCSGPGSQPSPMFAGGFVPTAPESYTRNLVGAAVASASVLKDESEKWCTFFVFQDISVRTEGVYRIKLTFVNLEVNGRVANGISEALAETYTEPFTVFSPRKFPGMLDPTPLSRKLASQGIKIPVRNDKKKQRQRIDDGGQGVGYEDEANDDDNEDE